MSRTLLALWTGAVLLGGCSTEPAPTDPAFDEDLDVALRKLLATRAAPIELPPPQDPAQVALGRALFFDKLLSGNRDVACATCHDPRQYGTDGLSLSIGTGGSGLGPDRVLGPGRRYIARNAPTLLNRGLEKGSLFWDGRLMEGLGGSFRAPLDVELPSGLPNLLAAQAMLPVLDRAEMRGDAGDLDVHGHANEVAEIDGTEPAPIWDTIMQRVFGVPEYRDMLAVAFPGTPADELTFRHAATAIAAFVTEAFTTAGSPFDGYVSGEDDALSPGQKRGGLIFFGRGGCVACHEGPLLGGTRFANAGAPQLGPGTGAGAPLDFGRSDVIDALGTPPPGENRYSFAFRVPSLRNVELTAPYMHDGAYATLDAVARHYDDVREAHQTYDVSQLAPPLRPLHHGDATTMNEVLNQLDFRLSRPPLDLDDGDRNDLVAFLEALTDPAARDMHHLIPARVPSGLPVN